MLRTIIIIIIVVACGGGVLIVVKGCKSKSPLRMELPRLRALEQLVVEYYRQFGHLPKLLDDLNRLDKKAYENRQVFIDCWGEMHVYELVEDKALPGGYSFVLRSAGPDKTLGTADDIEVRPKEGWYEQE